MLTIPRQLAVPHVAVIVATQVPGERGPPPGASIDADEALARTFQDGKLPAWMVDADGELAKMMHVRTPTLRCCPCRLNVLACLCFNPGRTFHGPHATGFGIRAVPWCDTVESCPLVHVLTVLFAGDVRIGGPDQRRYVNQRPAGVGAPGTGAFGPRVAASQANRARECRTSCAWRMRKTQWSH